MTNLDITKAYVGSTEVSKVYIGDSQVYPSGPPPTPVYSAMPLTFEIISGGTIVWKKANASAPDCQISYSMDDGATWTTISPTTAGTSFNVSAGDKVLFKGDNSNYCATATTTGATERNYYDCFAGTALFEAEGNIMSLIDSEEFTTDIALPSSGWNFKSLFQGCTGIVSAENLKLPASALTMCCYRSMFDGCTNLTKAPELPATDISNAVACYAYMFQSCPITVAPELPATTLAMSCYYAMFKSGSTLTSAPELPATTLADSCYNGMFMGCTSLTTAPSSIGTSATTMGASACTQMFSSCTGLTIAPELPATTLANYCYFSMFYGCTSLTTAPELPATTLVDYCYAYMFNGCNSLNYIKCLTTNKSASNCTTGWVNGVAATGTFECVLLEQWGTGGSSGRPNGWTAIDDFDYLAAPLTFKVLSGGTTSWRADNTGFTKTIYYKVNDGEWTSITSTTAGTPMSFNAGDVVQFKGDGPCATGNGYTNRFRDYSSDLRYNVYGNIMSLIDSTGYTTATTVDDHALRQEFAMQPVVSAKNLVLPATTVGANGYKAMFDRCPYLTKAPELPATTVGISAYQQMFYGCTGLTLAPSTLLADTIGDQCYEKMFSGCTSLVTPPASIGTSAMTMAASACSNMFYGCTNLESAPVLPAATLNVACYRYMFYGCISLNDIICLATDISASNCTSDWVRNVSHAGTFVKNPNITEQTWGRGNSGIPTNWTVQDA